MSSKARNLAGAALLAFTLAGPVFAVEALAAPLVLTLERATLNNVPDAAGTWQFEGGRVLQGSRHIAQYASTKRVVTGGTNLQNTAMLTITIFFLGRQPPQNITLQGDHDFNSGGQIGSVSAASSAFSSRIDKQFTRVGNTLTIN